MPSPFPGMDPWLEHRAIFPDLHDRFVAALSEELNAVLPEPYFATLASRIAVHTPPTKLEPDVNIVRAKDSVNGGGRSGLGGLAMATEPIVANVLDERLRHKYLEIRTAGHPNRLVTVIELLSRSNKSSGMNNRDLYTRKQREVITQRIHLVEIDLLRKGRHTTAVPDEVFFATVGSPDYHVCVTRSDRPNEFHLYPIMLADRLPTIRVPLLADVGDVPADLQRVLGRCYEAGLYARRVDYREPARPRLTPRQARWAEQVLRERGLLPPSPS